MRPDKCYMSFILLPHPSFTFLYGDFVHSRRFYSHLRLSSGNRHSGEILAAFIGSYSYFHIRTHIDYNIIFRGNKDILYYPDMHPQTHILIQIESYSAILPPHRSRFHSQAEALTYFYAGSSLSSIPFLID